MMRFLNSGKGIQAWAPPVILFHSDYDWEWVAILNSIGNGAFDVPVSIETLKLSNVHYGNISYCASPMVRQCSACVTSQFRLGKVTLSDFFCSSLINILKLYIPIIKDYKILIEIIWVIFWEGEGYTYNQYQYIS